MSKPDSQKFYSTYNMKDVCELRRLYNLGCVHCEYNDKCPKYNKEKPETGNI